MLVIQSLVLWTKNKIRFKSLPFSVISKSLHKPSRTVYYRFIFVFIITKGLLIICPAKMHLVYIKLRYNVWSNHCRGFFLLANFIDVIKRTLKLTFVFWLKAPFFADQVETTTVTSLFKSIKKILFEKIFLDILHGIKFLFLFITYKRY